MATPLSFRAQIHALLDRFFDEEELQTLCFELGADFDNLSGDTKTSKARELIEWCERSEKMTALRAAIVRLRPNAQDELAAIPETEKAPVQPIRPTPQPAQPKVQGWVWSAAAGLGLIGIVASVWFGLRGRQVAPTTTPRVATSTPQPALPTAMPPTAQATSAASRDADQLEAALTAANIQLSDGPDTTNKVREYLASDMAYIQLAENCLRILAGRRLTKPIALDVINGRYSFIKTGNSANYTTDMNDLNATEKAVLKTWEENYGNLPTSLADITESNPAPAEPTDGLVDDFERAVTVASLLRVDTDGTNTGTLSYASSPHVGHGNQAVRFDVDFRNIEPDPSNNYINLFRNLPQPNQDWSHFSKLCAWVEVDADMKTMSLSVGNEYPQIHDQQISLKAGGHEYCLPLRPILNNIDLTRINFYQINFGGLAQERKTTIYIDHVYLQP